jgi:hypothetical protein
MIKFRCFALFLLACCPALSAAFDAKHLRQKPRSLELLFEEEDAKHRPAVMKPKVLSGNAKKEAKLTSKLHSMHHEGDDDAPVGDISFHGGSVMPRAINLYTMWFGSNKNEYEDTQLGQNTVELVTDFMNNIGGSDAYNVITSYSRKNGVPLSSTLTLMPENVIRSGRTVVGDASVRNNIKANIESGLWELDTNALYVVFFQGSLPYNSFYPNFGGFATHWCGFHSFFRVRVDGKIHALKYAVIGDPNYTPDAVDEEYGDRTALQLCTHFPEGSVNDNPGADGE